MAIVPALAGVTVVGVTVRVTGMAVPTLAQPPLPALRVAFHQLRVPVPVIVPVVPTLV